MMNEEINPDISKEQKLSCDSAGPDNASTDQAQQEPVVYDPLQVKLPKYEGPLDLLLDLIKKNEMDIYDIQVSVITKQYLDYLHCMRELNLEVAGEFVVMAATLIYIKSKMLLPVDELTDDDSGEDPRAELVRKLLEYQAFKEAARQLGSLEDERGRVFTRQITDYYLSNLSGDEVEIDTFSANLFDLLQAFRDVLQGLSKKNVHNVYEEVISIEEKIEQLKSRFSETSSMRFSELLNGRITKNELIVTFLALLELIRSKFVRVSQEKNFGEINIVRIAERINVSGVSENGGENGD